MLLTRWRGRRPHHFPDTAALALVEAFANAIGSGNVKKYNARIWDFIIDSITVLLVGAALIVGMVIIWIEFIVIAGCYLLLVLLS